MVKIVCISDTHGYNRRLDLPAGDILVHTGDFSMGRGSLDQVEDFNDWLGGLEFSHKIVIPGNHDIPVEKNLDSCRKMMSNCSFLVNEEIKVMGLKFYGSPTTPSFGSGWAFNIDRGTPIAKEWAAIPDDTDVLLTHGPCYKILDKATYGNENAGCEELLKRVNEIRPKLAVCGHIHEAYGMIKINETTFVNASICNLRYNPINAPIVVDIPDD